MVSLARRSACLPLLLLLPAVLPVAAAAAFQLRPCAAHVERGRPSRVGRTSGGLPLSSSSSSSGGGGKKKDRWRRRSQHQELGAGEKADRRFLRPTIDSSVGDGDGPDDYRGGQGQQPAAVPTLADGLLKGQIELLRRLMRSRAAREEQTRKFRGVDGGGGALAPNRKGRARTLWRIQRADDQRRGITASETKRRLDLGYSRRKSQQRGRPKRPRNRRRRRNSIN